MGWLWGVIGFCVVLGLIAGWSVAAFTGAAILIFVGILVAIVVVHFIVITVYEAISPSEAERPTFLTYVAQALTTTALLTAALLIFAADMRKAFAQADMTVFWYVPVLVVMLAFTTWRVRREEKQEALQAAAVYAQSRHELARERLQDETLVELHAFLANQNQNAAPALSGGGWLPSNVGASSGPKLYDLLVEAVEAGEIDADTAAALVERGLRQVSRPA
jgi:FlaA1/EpsC-like NDP-sugar epimerase